MGFTNNYLTIINTSLVYVGPSTSQLPSDRKTLNGGTITNTIGTKYENVFSVSDRQSPDSYILFLSSNTTSPSAEDYSDSIDRIGSYTLTNTSYLNGNVVHQSGKTTLNMVYTNTTESPQSIAKIGLTQQLSTIQHISADSTMKNISSQYVLIATELLPEPITLQAGETGTFSLTLDYTKLITEAKAN